MPPFLCFLLAVSLLKVAPKGQCGQAVCVPKHRQVVRCLMEKMHLLDELCSGWSSGAIGHKPQMTIVDCVCLSPLGAFVLLGLFLILISVTCPIDCYIKETVEFLKGGYPLGRHPAQHLPLTSFFILSLPGLLLAPDLQCSRT